MPKSSQSTAYLATQFLHDLCRPSLGVAVLAIMENGFILIGVSSYWSQCFIGLVIIAGVSVIGLERKRKRKRNHARRVIAGPAMTPRTNTGGAE